MTSGLGQRTTRIDTQSDLEKAVHLRHTSYKSCFTMCVDQALPSVHVRDARLSKTAGCALNALGAAC